MNDTINALRQLHRRERAALGEQVLADNAAALKQRIESLEVYQRSTRVAAYIAIRGEIALDALINSGSAQGKQFYLPVLDGNLMHFAPWQPQQPLVKKGFGLLEPDVSAEHYIAPQELDLVLTPLVVFDAACNRIGQGGGFYDRTFAHKLAQPQALPAMVGVAHDSQREAGLQPQSWDVPLDIIATNAATYFGMS